MTVSLDIFKRNHMIQYLVQAVYLFIVMFLKEVSKALWGCIYLIKLINNWIYFI